MSLLRCPTQLVQAAQPQGMILTGGVDKTSGVTRNGAELIGCRRSNHVLQCLERLDLDYVSGGLDTLIGKGLGKRGPGVFNVPGLMKVKVIRKPATKARKGINPFTKEETVFKAKPARNVVKIQPLKALKDMV